jgi:hypothetical protein
MVFDNITGAFLMTTKLFGDNTVPVATKTILWIIFLALTFRIGILLLNGYWDHSPHWGFLPRTGLAVAWSDFGTIPLPDGFEALFKVSLADAMRSWQLNDRGLTFLFVFMHKIFGQVTYLHIQIIHLFLDALMVLPVMGLVNRIAGLRGAVVAGVAYALFLPQAQMAVSPDYNSWLGGLLVVMTWIAAQLIETRQISRFVLLILLMIAINVIGNEFRSIVALFAFGAAGWLWLVSIGVHRTLLLPVARWQSISGLLLVGVTVLLLSASTNYYVRGEFSPVRSSFGHAFFTGVGQFKNPIGMRDSDAAPAQWYTRETGISDTNSTLDPAYNTWLNEKAKAFVTKYPVLYGSMVMRRAGRILFPNMAFTLVTDLPSYTLLPDQKKLVELRKALVAQNGWASMTTLLELGKVDPAYLFGLGWRILLMIILPLGLGSAIWLAKSRAAGVFATLPLVYGILTLSFVYVTPPVVTGIQAAILTVSASGLYLLYRRAKEIYLS